MTEHIQATLLSKFAKVDRNGNGWQVQCPAHEDRQASLHIEQGKTQPVVLTCHAGCDRDAILDALGLTWADLCTPSENGNGHDRSRGSRNGRRIVAVYEYTDERGKVLYHNVRFDPKDFRQRVPDRTVEGGYRWKLGDTRRVLYRLPNVIKAIENGEMIWLAEGEKDVHALEAAGVTASNSGAAGSGWRPEFAEHFRDAIVRIVADCDPQGRKHARAVAASLEGVARAVEVVEAAVGKDASDHLAAGKALHEFLVTHENVPDEPVLAPDLYEFLSESDPAEVWVIPQLLERSDRLILTGEEGRGKSQLTRQWAVAAAAGIHPFTDCRFTPQKVLFIDCENPVRKSRRHFRSLADVARAKRAPVPDGGFRIIHRPAGVDLSRPDEREWLIERVTAHKPDLLVIGPLYKLHALDINDEQAARVIVAALDEARIKADCALLVEAHAPHGSGGERALRPFGSSLFMRWPEFGYGIRMAPAGKTRPASRRIVTVTAWRGPREEREWPRAMKWGRPGADWPWVPTKLDADGDEVDPASDPTGDGWSPSWQAA